MTTAMAQAADVRSRLSIRAVLAALAVVALAAGTVVAVTDHYHPVNSSTESAYTAADLRALADLRMPAAFTSVTSTWSCVSNEQSICFNSSLSGLDAVHAVAASVGVKAYTTTLVRSPMSARYTMCTTIGTAPAAIVLTGRASNAVLQEGTWLVPPGQTPKFKGTVVDVFLTGPGNCPYEQDQH